MISFLLRAFMLFLLAGGAASAKDGTQMLDLATLGKPGAWTLSHVVAETASRNGAPAAYLVSQADSANGNVGLALPTGVSFDTGTIELDLKGKSVRGSSFLGVAFNVVNDRTFEAVYFRPFNFKAMDPFRERAVQYVSWPTHTWEKLRKEHPRTFENAVTPVPDPDDWFHARIEVGATQVRVFVNNAKAPSLVVERLSGDRSRRPMGLFVDTADAHFAKVRVTPGNG